MLSLKHGEYIPQMIKAEFEALIDEFNALWLEEHNEDGSHITPPPAEISDLGLPVGTLIPYAGSTVPTGWLLCDGTAISRSTYTTLFGVVSTTYGSGDGATTFNLPDLRQRFPLGKAASGTGSTLGATGGAIDHTHTGPSHTHTGPSHTHTGPSHTHTGPSHTHSISADGTGATGASGTGATGAASDTVEVVATPAGGTFVATAAHTHTGPSHTHTGPSHDHTAATGSEGTGATGASGTGATGAEGTGATGSSGAGNTGTANPPFVALNYLILYS